NREGLMASSSDRGRLNSKKNQRAKRGARRLRPLRVEWLENRNLLTIFHPLAGAVDGAANSLRAAIIAANTNHQNDTIYLQGSLYQLSITNSSGQENAAQEGDLDLTESGFSVTFIGAGPSLTRIDAATIDRVFQIFSGVTVTFKNLTIENGLARDDGTEGVL